MDKCEWKDGKFEVCDSFIPTILCAHDTETGQKTNYPGCGHCLNDIRKPEPKQPTHEEIMTKWWLFNSRWLKVLEYWPINGGECHYLLKSEAFEDGCTWLYKQGFQGRESADIPPEDK